MKKKRLLAWLRDEKKTLEMSQARESEFWAGYASAMGEVAARVDRGDFNA